MEEHIPLDKLTPEKAILEELGRRLCLVRKGQKRSQDSLATQAGIGVATLRRIEDGKDSQLSSWLKLLKALGMEASIEALLPVRFDSPMADALANKKGSKGTKRAGHPFKWGDQTS